VIDRQWRRYADRLSVAAGKLGYPVPARRVLFDGAPVPRLRRRVVVARLELAVVEHNVADFRRVIIGPLPGGTGGRVPLDLDHVDLGVAGFAGTEKSAVGKAQRNPREARLRAQQGEKDKFTLAFVCYLDGALKENRTDRLLHGGGGVEHAVQFVMDRLDDLPIELPDDIADIAMRGEGPEQMDQQRGQGH